MKSVKMLLGTVLCLVMLSGHAMATSSTTKTLTFDDPSIILPGGLGDYGQANGVSLVGWFPAAPDGNLGLQTMAFKTEAQAEFQFGSDNPVGLFSFQYIYSGGEDGSEVTVSGYDKTYNNLIGSFKLDQTESLSLVNAIVPESWANFFLGKIVFSIESGSFIIDNVNLNMAPTPLPGAAIFLFSGLLGLVGLRRRQIV